MRNIALVYSTGLYSVAAPVTNYFHHLVLYSISSCHLGSRLPLFKKNQMVLYLYFWIDIGRINILIMLRIRDNSEWPGDPFPSFYHKLIRELAQPLAPVSILAYKYVPTICVPWSSHMDSPQVLSLIRQYLEIVLLI